MSKTKVTQLGDKHIYKFSLAHSCTYCEGRHVVVGSTPRSATVVVGRRFIRTKMFPGPALTFDLFSGALANQHSSHLYDLPHCSVSFDITGSVERTRHDVITDASGQLHAPAALSPGTSSRLPLHRKTPRLILNVVLQDSLLP
jgi:hypothetical protein